MAQWGAQRLWSYDRRSSMKQLGIPIEIHVGEPVDPSGDPELATARLRESISDLVGRAQENYPDDGIGQCWHPARLGGTAPEPGHRD